MNVSLNHLSSLTGMSYRTLKKRLTEAGIRPIQDSKKPGCAILFESSEALPILYGVTSDADQLDLSQERAVLAQEQTRKLKLENDLKEGHLVPTDLVTETLAKVGKQIISILDSIPLSIKKRVPVLESKDVDFIRKEIAKCRNAIANMDIGARSED
ncbi:MAG: terminase small subunit [Desulfobulbaceae bacterium]|nr:terminase small subunit [Desulfobulbaceae bacterium]